MSRPQAFISYSHKDSVFVDRLRVHVKPLEQIYDFVIWDDSRIKPGQLWKDQISANLQSSHVIVIVMSADFLASEFVMTNEYPVAIKAAHDRGAHIIMIFASPCLYEDFEVSDFQAINSPEETLQDYQDDNMGANQERIFVKAARSIRDYLKEADQEAGQ